jgi:flagellar hook assembly protein FlgD
MKYNRFFLAAALGCCFTTADAQLTAFINGKEVKSGATVSPKDLASLQVSFKKPKDVTVISGASVLYVNLLDAKKQSIQQWYIQKEGYVAIDDFLKHTTAQKKFKTFGTDADFHEGGNTLDWVIGKAGGQESQKTIQVKIGFYVVEETGYKQYGPQVQLLEPIIFNVPAWDTKNLFLSYLDLTIDKTNIPGDIDLKQNGRLGDKGTLFGYTLKDKSDAFYSIYALDSRNYPGMNVKELADDFMHAAAMYASQDYITKFSNYDIEKYTLPWDDINDLLSERRRIPSLSWKGNKEIKKMDLLTLLTPVEINGMKGYSFKADEQARTDRSSKWEDRGKFVIYILSHPTNPNLTLVASTSMYNSAVNTDQQDAFLTTLIKSIKH